MVGKLIHLAVGQPGELIARLIVLIVAILLLGLVVLVARRLFLSAFKGPPKNDLSVEDIEAMRDSRQISEDEYNRLRRSAAGLVGKSEEKDKSQSSADTKVDD